MEQHLGINNKLINMSRQQDKFNDIENVQYAKIFANTTMDGKQGAIVQGAKIGRPAREIIKDGCLLFEIQQMGGWICGGE